MLNNLLLLFIAIFVLFLTACKKEDAQKKANFPAVLELTSDINSPTASGMVSPKKETFLVQLATDGAKVDFANRASVRLVEINTAQSAASVTTNRHFLPTFTSDPNYRASIAFNKTLQRTIFATSSSDDNVNTIFTLRLLDVNGITVFGQTISGPSHKVEISKVIPTNNGYLVCGTAIQPNGDKDVYLASYTSSNSRLWQKIFSGTANDGGMDAVQLCDGNIGLLAYTYSLGKGDRDVWYIKVDAATGNFITGVAHGTSGYEEPQRIITDNNCKLYIAGHTSGFGHPEHNAYIICIDQNGNLIWENTYGTPLHDGFQAITFLPGNKGLLAAGRSMQANAPFENIFVQATDLEGKPLWSKTYGDPNLTEIPVDIVTDEAFYYLLSNRIDATGNFSVIFVKDELVK